MPFVINFPFNQTLQANRFLEIGLVPRVAFNVQFQIPGGTLPDTWTFWGRAWLAEVGGVTPGFYFELPLYLYGATQAPDTRLAGFQPNDGTVYDQLVINTVPWLPDGLIRVISEGDPPP